MDFLDLELPAQSAFRLEQQRRELQACGDPDALRSVAEGLLRHVHHLSNVVGQLMVQVGRLEVELAQADALPLPSDEHLEAARSMFPGADA